MTNPFHPAPYGAGIPADQDNHPYVLGDVSESHDRTVEKRLESLRGIAQQVVLELEELANTSEVRNDPDLQLQLVAILKEIKKPGVGGQPTVTTCLWNRYGAGTHLTPGGAKFAFARPGARRSTDYKLLESDYPDAYSAAVSTSQPAPDAVGKLTLK